MKLNRIQRILQRVTHAQMNRPWWFLGIALGLSAISILYTLAHLFLDEEEGRKDGGPSISAS